MIEASQPIPEHRRTFKSVNLLCLLKLISIINNVLIKLIEKKLRKPTNFVSKYQIFCSILSKVSHIQKRCVHSWTPCIQQATNDISHARIHSHLPDWNTKKHRIATIISLEWALKLLVLEPHADLSTSMLRKSAAPISIPPNISMIS